MGGIAAPMEFLRPTGLEPFQQARQVRLQLGLVLHRRHTVWGVERKKCYRNHRIGNNGKLRTLCNNSNLADFSIIGCLAYAFKTIFKPRAVLIAENLCLPRNTDGVFAPYNTSQQLRHYLIEILDHERLQDPPSVLRYANYVVLKLPNAMRTLADLHGFIVQTTGSFIHG